MTAYVALNRYAGPRGGGRPVVELTCLYADLDTYRQPEFMFLDRAEIEEAILGRIDSYGLPVPSVLVDSGRGFYALWLIEPLSGRALQRWQVAQRCLVERLAPLGADPACCDAARVLRIPGTVNGKVGRMVTVVRGDGRRYRFDDLADAIYRAADRPTRRQLAARRGADKAVDDSPTTRGLPPAMRFVAVLRDLERFRTAWGGEIPEGLRNTWLHLVVTALGFVLPADEIEAEARRLAALGTPGLPEAEVKATLKAAILRAEAVAGRFHGLASDPRLHYSGHRMAEILGIDCGMAKAIGLEQIVPEDLRRDRRNAARRARRAAAGGQSRETYLAGRRVSRERPWEALGMSRSTWYARGLHEGESMPPAPSDGLSTPRMDWTGAVTQQGAPGAAEGPERSSRNSDDSEPIPSPPGGPTASTRQPMTAPSQRPGPKPDASCGRRNGMGTARFRAHSEGPISASAAASPGPPRTKGDREMLDKTPLPSGDAMSDFEREFEEKVRAEMQILYENRHDAIACRAVLLAGRPVKTVIGPLSTSEAIAVALAFGRTDLLPRSYRNFRDAWRRLDSRQRRLVDLVARLPWSAREEGSPVY
jgi:hypothetical protein